MLECHAFLKLGNLVLSLGLLLQENGAISMFAVINTQNIFVDIMSILVRLLQDLLSINCLSLFVNVWNAAWWASERHGKGVA